MSRVLASFYRGSIGLQEAARHPVGCEAEQAAGVFEVAVNQRLEVLRGADEIFGGARDAHWDIGGVDGFGKIRKSKDGFPLDWITDLLAGISLNGNGILTIGQPVA
jgi:hypothetical protein